jgi:hypothetical protein
MPYFSYKKEGQNKYSLSIEPFLKGVKKEQLFTLPTDKDSQSKIRILPPWSAEGAFALGTIMHWGVGLQKKMFICPSILSIGACPFCIVHAKIKSDKKYENTNDLQAVRPVKRYYSNVAVIGKAENMVYSYGWTVFNALQKLQDSGEYGDFTDPMNGRDIIINRTVQGKKITDTVYPSGSPTPVENADLLEKMWDLDLILPEPDLDGIVKAFESHPWQIYEPGVSRTAANKQEPVTPTSQELTPDEQLKEIVSSNESQESKMEKLTRLQQAINSQLGTVKPAA